MLRVDYLKYEVGVYLAKVKKLVKGDKMNM